MRRALAVALALAGSGCLVGPDYRRPEVDVSGAYRGARAGDGRSLGDAGWSEVFTDPTLRQLISVALEHNLDLAIAGTRIEQARALAGIARADQWPAIGLDASGGRQRIPATGAQDAFETNLWRAEVSASWQLDFWGKYRRGTEAAKAELLAAHWGRRAVTVTLIADVATGYFQLRELDLELDISRRTLVSRRESLELVKLQEHQGAVSMVDVRQGEQLVTIAAQTIIDLERRIVQQENVLRTLIAANPGTVARGKPLTEQPVAPVVPAGLPSALIDRRPDIRVAEARLVAANARIGVARAAYFPDIALTASGGVQSGALGDLVSAGAALWSVAGALTQPIFAGGRIRAGVELSEAQRDEALLVYRQTILQAFREVSDALIAGEKNREFRVAQETLTEATRDAARLSESRYAGGATGYLEVLDSNTRLFAAELGLAQARLAEVLAMVQLYRALGGGWQGRS